MRVTRIGGPRNSNIGLSSSSFSEQPAYRGGLAENWDAQIRYSVGSTMEDRIRGRRGYAAAKRDFPAYFSRNDPPGGIGGGMASTRQTGTGARSGGAPYGVGESDEERATLGQTGTGAWPGDAPHGAWPGDAPHGAWPGDAPHGAWSGGAPYGVGESDEERATLEWTSAEAHRLSSMFGDRGMMDLFNGLGGLANV